MLDKKGAKEIPEKELKGENRNFYQDEIQAPGDNPRKIGGDLRIIPSIDDGGFLSALFPHSTDFILNSDGKR